MPDYITKRELASLLRVSTRTITNYQRQPDFPAPVRAGKLNLWPRTEVVDYLKQRLASIRDGQ